MKTLLVSQGKAVEWVVGKEPMMAGQMSVDMAEPMAGEVGIVEEAALLWEAIAELEAEAVVQEKTADQWEAVVE